MCVDVCVCCLLHNPRSKAHVGAHIYCRRGNMDDYMNLRPEWKDIGTLGTEGFEGESAEADIPESWGWVLSNDILYSAAQQAHGRA